MTNVNAAVLTDAIVDAIEIADMTPVREAVALEIRALLDTIGQQYIKVGTLLIEARQDFENQGEFLAWSLAEFGIKKAQCYNLMKIAKTFDGDKRFSTVSMRVMLALTEHAADESLMAKAAELAADGCLTTNALNELVSPAKPKKAAEAQEIAPAANEDAAPQNVPAETDDGDDLPWEGGERETSLNPALVAPYGVQTESEANPQPTAKEPENDRIAGLLGLIETLKETNQRLAEQLAAQSSERTAKKAAAPMLPHFKHKAFPVRLGLTDEEATKKTNVNKAKRELVKAGYGEGHEAWAFISEAVEALTKA